MDTKIKLLLLSLFTAFNLFGQSPLSLAVRYNISSATGGDPYTIVGVVSDDLSRFTGSDVAIGDSLYVIDGSDLYVLKITAINSVVGPTVNLTADDPSNAGISLPTGQSAIVRPTPNYKLPIYISGLRDDLRSMMMNRQAKIIDQITGGGGGSSITDFTSAGVNVPPSPAASLNGGETWRNMTTGELWGSDGNVWYPYTRGPKECQDTVLVSAITVQSGGSVTTGSPLIRNSSGVWEHMYNHPSGLNLVPDGVVTDIVTGGKAIIQYCGVRKGSGATPNTSYYVNQSISTGFTTTKPTTNIRPLGKVASNGDFLINAGLLFSRDNSQALPRNQIGFGNSTGTAITSVKGMSYDSLFLYSFLPSKRFNLGDSATLTNKTLDGITIRNRYSVPGNPAYRGDSYYPLIFESPTLTSESTSFMFRHSGNSNQVYPGGCINCGGTSPVDSTRNEVFAWGFNINGRQKPAFPGLHYAIEPSWYNGGQLWQEAHLEWYNPYFATAPFKAVYGDRSITRPFTTQIKNIKSPLLTTSDWSFQCDNMTWINTKSGFIYSLIGRDDITKNTSLEMSAGNNFGMRTTVDSINKQITIIRLPVAANQNYYKIQGFGRFSLTDDAGRNVIESISQSQEVFFGQSGRDNNYSFMNNGSGSIRSIQNLTTSNYTGRSHFTLLNAAQDDGVNLGFRNDAKFFFMAQRVTSAFSSSFKSYSFGRTISGSYPQGSAFFNIYTEQANTKPVLLVQTSTDSVKYFVTSVNPNTVITGRVGDIANGSNGTTYIKKTGNNTNTGWEAIVSTSGTSTSISTMMREESFIATAAQTAFTIAYSAPAVSGTSTPLRVYRNGVRLFYVASGPTITQFTYSGTTVTTAANTVGDIITIEYLN